MTAYGTNPTSSRLDPAPRLEYIHIKSGLATRRPWNLMFDYRFITFPRNLADAASRIRTNAAFFQTNYAILVLFAVFLSLLWRPISLIVLLAVIAAWLFLYFLRDEPLVVFERLVDDRVVLLMMSVLTLAILLLTDSKANVLAAVSVGTAAVVAHSAVRKTDDLFLDEEERAALVSGTAESESSSPP